MEIAKNPNIKFRPPRGINEIIAYISLARPCVAR